MAMTITADMVLKLTVEYGDDDNSRHDFKTVEYGDDDNCRHGFKTYRRVWRWR